MKDEWRDVGNNIRNIIQDAVNSQDYKKLNQTIRDTIDSALEGAARGIRRGASWAGSCCNGHHDYGAQDKCAGSPRYGEGSGAASERSIRPADRNVFALQRTGRTKAGGWALSIIGGVLGVGTGVALAAVSLTALAAGEVLGLTIARGILLPCFIGGIVMALIGSRKRSLVKRFRSYISAFGGRTYCEIKELAKKVDKSRGYVVKDVRRMIGLGWFAQGHLDDGETCLIADDATYAQYRATMRQAEIRKAEENQPAEAENGRKLSPEAEEVLRTGKAYVEKIRACNDAIPGEEISEKISRMELVIGKIFDRAERHPENIDDLRKLMEYYLPTTVKLLEAYEELSRQPVQGENIKSSQREIEDTLDTLNEAFERLFDSMFQDTAWDVSTDISVLKTMLAQEGLAEDGLKRK